MKTSENVVFLVFYQALVHPRFLPVKMTSDLLLVMSNLYSLESGALSMSSKVCQHQLINGVMKDHLEDVLIHSAGEAGGEGVQESEGLPLQIRLHPRHVGAGPSYCVW